MRKIIKKILSYIFLAMVGFIIAAILLPFVFKDKLMTSIKDYANDNINAVVDFSDANLSFFSSFPDIRISIDSLSVTGIDNFDGIALFKSNHTYLDINFMSLIRKGSVPKINSVIIKETEINVVIVDSLNANYLITKESTNDPYRLTLDYYRIENGKLTYQDNTNLLFCVLQGIEHEGNGDFTQDIFDLSTKTHVNQLDVKYAGTQYISNGLVDITADININFPENKYTIKDNNLKLNDLELTGEGYVKIAGNDITTDLVFKTPSEDFKSLLSIIPNAYTKDFANVKTSGKASFSGNVRGLYNEAKNQFPAFDIKILVENGYFKYPSFPEEISSLNADINIKATRSDYKDMVIRIPKFGMKVGNDPINGKLTVNNLSGDQKAEGQLQAKINLTNLASAYPLGNIDQLSGNINCDLDFKANMKDVKNENYSAIVFKGHAEAQNVVYQSKGMPKIKFNKAYANATPAELSFNAENLMLGKSDLHLTGSVKNPLAMFSTEKSVTIKINGKSSLFDLNEWIPEQSDNKIQKNSEQAGVSIQNDVLKNSNLFLDLDAKKVLFHDIIVDKLALKGGLAANAIDIENMSASIEGSDLRMKGTIINVYDYLFNNGILDGALHFYSKKFNANTFISNNNDKNNSKQVSVIPVPERVRLTVKAEIDELDYTNLILRDFKGDLEIKNQEVALRNLVTNTLGGNISMEGLYNTSDITNPDFSIKLSLSKIKFAEAISKIDLLKKAAPVAAYIDGIFNTTLVMKGTLGDQMTPVLSSLDASGFLETLSGSIKGYNPLSELSDKLGLNMLKEITLDHTKNWFDIVKGYIELKEFKKTIGGMELAISGKHGFGQNMNYNIDMVIPRELLKNNKITAFAESGLSMLEKEASKLGVNINQGPNIFLNVQMTGNLKKPVFRITPKNSKGETLNNAVESKVENIISSLKDTINNEIKRKEAEIIDTITKRANEEIEKIKTKAEDAAETAIDSLKSKARDVVSSKIDSLAKSEGADSLKQKATDILTDKSKEEVDKIKEKLKDFNPFKKKGKGNTE